MLYKLFIAIGVILLIGGCSTSRELDDFKESYGVFYPVKKAGQSIEFIGESVGSVASVARWRESRPDPLNVQTTKDDEKILNSRTVKFNLDIPYELQTGYGSGSMSFPALGPFLFQVEKIAGFQFDWRLNPNLNEVAMAYPRGVIVVNPKRLERLSKNAQMFTLLHEAAHHVLQHTSSSGTLKTMNQPWSKKVYEIEADTWAAQRMLGAGAHPQQIVYAALEIFNNNPETALHPSGAKRVANVRNAISRF